MYKVVFSGSSAAPRLLLDTEFSSFTAATKAAIQAAKQFAFHSAYYCLSIHKGDELIYSTRFGQEIKFETLPSKEPVHEY